MNAHSLDIESINYRRRSVRSTMLQVMVALLPGTALYAYLISSSVLSNIVIACLAALGTEALILILRGRKLLPALGDGSTLLAAWLLALCLPPSLPGSHVIIGAITMVALGKHLFGGLGHNPFNPAMVAYAVLLVSFPVTMTDWQFESPYQTVNTPGWDAVSSATPLDRLRELKLNSDLKTPDAGSSTSALSLQNKLEQHKQLEKIETQITQSIWGWLSASWLLGGLYLLAIRVISWHIPLSVLATLALIYLVMGFAESPTLLSLLPAMLSGSLIFGAFFIATDPVTAATSPLGKLLYGCGIGIFTFVIRENSVYPEGFAFAVLLMNMCVPLIDRTITSSNRSGKLPNRTS
ncbi:MAG: RnfABCDGE type electron transport complex subunit D [Granulosicoccus sp.]